MLFNRDKIILDLCGGTGAWSKHYADAGYDVRIVTLPEQNVIDYIPPENVYGILAAPPCTMFSRARQTAATPRDFIEGMGPVNACIRIAHFAKSVFFALENPAGMLKRFIGEYQYSFHPWYFGDPYTKLTALWGWFNGPIEKYCYIKDVMTDEQIEKCRTNNRDVKKALGLTYAERRAITPAGFAKAFFEANQ